MLKRINLELRGRPPNKMQELDLDGVKCIGEIDFGDLQMDNLEALTLTRANLTSLKNFPTLPSLVKLDLCSNRLSKGLENLKHCTKLKCLILNENRFKPTKELEFLEPLASLPNLTHLELGEKFYNEDDEELNSNKIRTKAFSLLPQLQYLDLMDKHGNPEDDNEDDEQILNGTLGDDDDDEDSDDISDGDDELEEEEDLDEDDEDDGESEEDERLSYNGVNGATQDYNDQGSDAEDEDDDEDEDTEAAPVVRGKKRKYDNEDLLQ